MTDRSDHVSALTLDQKRQMLASLLRRRDDAGVDVTPLSQGQHALWFLNQIVPESSAYNVSFTARITSPVDLPSLQRAWEGLVARHAVLGCHIPSEAGTPVLRRMADPPSPVSITEASEWSRARLLAAIEADIRRPFDLSQGPLFRVRLFNASAGEVWMAAVVHHIVLDGWSLWMCLSELAALYTSARTGAPVTLPASGQSFDHFVRAERAMLAGPSGARHKAFWRTVFADGAPAMNLPTDRVRPPVPRRMGAIHPFALEADRTSALAGLAKQDRGSLQMAVLALFQYLLHRYTAQADLVVGYLASGRVRPEFELTVGLFANAMPIRSRVADGVTFRSLLRQTRDTLLEALDHQEYPFAQIVESIAVGRDPSRSPLFQTLFVFDKTQVLEDQDIASCIVGEPGARLTLGELELESLPFAIQGHGQFDLTFLAGERRGGLALALDYDVDLYDAATVARMAGHWRQLAAAVIAEPDRALATIDLLTPAEEADLARWNETAAAIPDGCFHQIVEAHARRQPDHAAVVFDDVTLTYAELDRQANQFARHLRRLGVGAGAIVGLCLERSATLIVSALGVLKAGAAFLPLDPAYPIARLAHMIEDSALGVLVTEQGLVDRLPVAGVRTVLADRDRPAWAAEPSSAVDVPVTPDDLMYVIYTSGSTGRPKGVLLPHRGLVNVSAEQQRMFGVGPGSQVLQFASLSFDAAVFEMSMALGSGGTLHMARSGELIPGLPLLDLLTSRGITIVTLPPSALLNLPASPLPRLKTITVAGEACPAELVTRWAAGREFFNLYGPTEATIWSTAVRCVADGRAPTIGRPIANTEAFVLDRAGRRVPVGVPGELHIGGVGLARGYHRRAELTDDRFVPNPFGVSGSRLYRTGDLVRWTASGELEFLGRIDHQVKVRGFRIELGEIETVLAQHADVGETVAIVREDAPGSPRIVAYVVPHPGHALSVDDVRAFARTRLPDFMVPSTVVSLDAMPLSPAGKVDRAALPRPEPASRPMTAPVTEPQQQIAAIWRETLNVEHVGIDDNFFDIGGSSLLLARVHARLTELGGPPISIVDMFQLPSIRALAARLAQTEETAVRPEQDGARQAGQQRLRDLARRRAGRDKGQ